MSDLNQVARMGRLFGAWSPAWTSSPCCDELRDRVVEELDYLRESRVTARIRGGVRRATPSSVIPHVLAAAPLVLVTEWVEGRPCRASSPTAPPRNATRRRRSTSASCCAGPARAGTAARRPTSGQLPDQPTDAGRARLRRGGPSARRPATRHGPLLRIAIYGDADDVLDGLRDEGFVRPDIAMDAQVLLDYLLPFVEPARHDLSTTHGTGCGASSPASRTRGARTSRWGSS